MATVTLTPKDPAKGEPIEVTSDKVNTDGTLNSDEQTAITAEAKKKNSDFNLSDYDAVIEGKKQSLGTADSSAKPAEKKQSSGGGIGFFTRLDYASLLGLKGLRIGGGVSYKGIEGSVSYNAGMEENSDVGFKGFQLDLNATYGMNVADNLKLYGLAGIHAGLIDGYSDCFLTQEQIDQITDSGGTVPDDLRTGLCGFPAGGAAFDRSGWFAGAHAGVGAKYYTPVKLGGFNLTLDPRFTVGTSGGGADGHQEGDDGIELGANFEWSAGVAFGLEKASKGKGKRSDNDNDKVPDGADVCPDTPDGEAVDPEGKLWSGCSKSQKDTRAAGAVTTETDEATGTSTHTVKTGDIPEDAGEDPKVREANITAKAGDTIVVEGPDGKGWPKGTKVKFNDDDPITETNEEAGVSLNPDEPVKITVPEGVTGENTIEIQNDKGETVVRIKLTVEEPEVKPEPIEDAKIDRVVVSSKDPNPEVRVTMTSPVAGKLEAGFHLVALGETRSFRSPARLRRRQGDDGNAE